MFVRASVRDLYPIARGIQDWTTAIARGSVEVFGAPALVRALPSWFVKPASDVAGRAALGHRATARPLGATGAVER